MPAINGDQYLARMKDLKANVWIKGQKITDNICEHPVYKGALITKASLYDLQLKPDLIKKMTYISPITNNRVGLSFLQPRTKEDLEARRHMMKTWALETAGMMGRTPDYLNTVIMTLTASASILSDQDEQFTQNLINLYETAREKDLSFTHSFINPQINRSISYEESTTQPPIAARIVKKNHDGVFIKGARLLATQGGMTDEIILFPSGGKIHDQEQSFCVSIPSNAEGVKFICRESYYLGESTFNYPLSSRFHEIDTMIIFDNVFVPWERVFFYHRQDIAMKLFSRSSFTAHTLHQVVIRQITKSEFILGLAQSMVKLLNLSEYHHIQEKISEMIIGLESLKALLDRAELLAKEDEWGTMVPHTHSLYVAVNMFPKLYPRMIEILQLIGAGGLVSIPSEEDFQSCLFNDLELYYQGTACDAETKTKILRLIWDLTMSSFGTRQTQYERYFFGDPVRLASTLYKGYPRDEYIDIVNDFLNIKKEDSI
ncbi:4-hydroxyphenylacetate 3-monooxygenase, oxygenase component [Metabacillus litoralis]|uniref:4-hydroxyphenylacetate 3-monooxygenase, oxygenase component n=1 Tax=Metabacillus litoralis TaxID=152268 RepID=UPI001CFF3C5F|nr:4-hydroxyphenylacetate 3-monooxygenase, oxygenase component [Metabacillus litoralis]